MSELSTALGVPYASGLSINGVPVPLAVEAAEGTRAQRTATIDGFVADFQAKGIELALVRADARLAGSDPSVAEAAFVTAQATAAPALDAPSAPLVGGLR